MKIWDMHCHMEPAQLPGRSFSQRLEYVLEVADRMGIEGRGLLLRLDELDEREVERALVRYRNRVFALVWMCLWKDRVARHIATLNRWVADGPMVGMKLAGNDGVCSWPIYEPVFQHAAVLGAPVVIHAWLKVGGDPSLRRPRPGCSAAVRLRPAPARSWTRKSTCCAGPRAA